MKPELKSKLDTLEDWASKATWGEWKVIGDNKVATESNTIIAEVVIPPLGYNAEKVARFDARFMAMANPSLIKEMITELRRLDKEADYLATILSGICRKDNDVSGCGLVCPSGKKACDKTDASDWRNAARAVAIADE